MRHAPRAALPPDDELARRVARTPLLVALDIDGTLAPIAPTPSEAEVPPPTRALLATLVRRPDTRVAVVTGRAARDGQRLVPVDGVWVIGNHGIERAAPGGALVADPDIAPYASRIADAVDALTGLTREMRGVLVENKQWTMSVHTRLADRDIVPVVERMVHDLGDQLGLRVLHGKEILELRPPVPVHKGTALLALARELGALDAGGVLYAGDDRTDEDAFELLREEGERAVTIRVGPCGAPGETAAEWFVDDTTDVTRLLAWLAARR